MLPTEKTYVALVLHLVTTLCLLLQRHYEKRLSSRLYTAAWRCIAMECMLCLATSVSLLPHDLTALVAEFYAEPHPLCVSDLDFTLRLLHLVWSLALCLCFLMHPSRTRKLTLAASCRYVALKYAYSDAKLMAICRKHHYACFPIDELELYARQIEEGSAEEPARVFTSGDIDHYLVELDRQEEALLNNDAQYARQVEQARAQYEQNRDPLVLARRRNATMSYEQYVSMKQRLLDQQ